MGLDISHDAFSGAYSAFNRLRCHIAKAWGGSHPPHDDRTLDDNMVYFPEGGDESHPTLAMFLTHSDCDGEIMPEDAGKLADELEALLPKITDQDKFGHLPGGSRAATEQLIKGCRAAYRASEIMTFG